MKDYYSLEEKKTHYRWRQFSPRLNDKQKAFAKKRYESLKAQSPRKYKPKYTTANKPYLAKLSDVYARYKKSKNLWNFLGDKHQHIIEDNQSKYRSELKRLDAFRHKYKLSLNDTIQIEKSNPVKG